MITATLPALETVATEMRRLATTQPDFVYEAPASIGGPVYVEKRAGKLVGSDLLGQAMVGLGVAARKLDHKDVSARGLFRRLGYRDTDATTVEWIERAQISQDQRYTWAESVATADSPI